MRCNGAPWNAREEPAGDAERDGEPHDCQKRGRVGYVQHGRGQSEADGAEAGGTHQGVSAKPAQLSDAEYSEGHRGRPTCVCAPTKGKGDRV